MINSVQLPPIANYYLSDTCIAECNYTIMHPIDILIDDILTVVVNNNTNVFQGLKLLCSKCKQITFGDMYKYEYETDVVLPNGELFNFIINGKTYKCIIFTVDTKDNNDLELKFHIKK